MSTIKKNDRAINEMIRAKEVRVTGADGEQLGVMDREAAQSIADEAGLDLVLIAPQASPPVCRIMDYGKFRFEQTKHEKEAKKKQKVIVVKEVQLSPTIEEHDVGIKARRTLQFLGEGHKIKVSIRFRGRQMAHTQIGLKVMDHFLEVLEDAAVVDSRPRLEGRNMIMMLSPNPKAAKKEKENEENAED